MTNWLYSLRGVTNKWLTSVATKPTSACWEAETSRVPPLVRLLVILFALLTGPAWSAPLDEYQIIM